MWKNRRWMAKQAKADSLWEAKLRDGVLSCAAYHDKKYNIEYVISHRYEPDFALLKNGQTILIEAKGRFRDSSEASKYKWVRESLKECEELVFLFYDPKKPMPHAKKRKDGTKLSHGEWAEKNGFKWYTEDTIKEIL